MTLNFKTLGQGDPLVILHGLFGTLDNWMTLAKVFAENHTVFLVDQRNHGHSPHDDEFNYEVMASDLRKFLIDHDIVNPILLGHSMGGKTVMKYAIDNPRGWSKLIVVDIAPRAYPVHHQQIIEGLKSLPVAEIASRGEADILLQEYIDDFGQRQFLLKNLKRLPEGGFGWKMNLQVIEREIATIGEGFSENLPVEGPVLFIRGEKSHYIRDEDFDDINMLFPGAEIVTVKEAGHWVHAEKPRELIELVQNFVDR